VIGRVALLCAAVAVALGLGEVTVRVLDLSRPALDLRGLHELRPDRPWLYGLRPGAEGRLRDTGDALYRINADGYRGPRALEPRPPGAIRAIVLGDSLAFGYGVEEAQAFPRVLEALAAERAPAARLEVVNLGVGGYNAWNEARLLEDVGPRLDPDLVLVQFCISDLNDPSAHFDAQTRLALAEIPDTAFPDPTRRAATAEPGTAWRACRASALCTRAGELWQAWRGPALDPERRRATFEPVEDVARPEWRWLEARYAEIASAAAARGAQVALLAMPYPQQLDGTGPHPVEQRLAAIARRLGWIPVDPLPAFRRAQAAGTPVFLDLWHPTPEGHRLVAEASFEALACAGMLGRDARGACRDAALAGSGRE
jgi:lysophospholipase L1-like esterase